METMKSELPKASVDRYVKGIHRTVEATGFSLAELRELKITAQDARRHGIYVDTRRRSKRDQNVTVLKEWLKENPNLSPKRPLRKKN
ncbi:MAG: ribosomal protein L13e [archaeon]